MSQCPAERPGSARVRRNVWVSGRRTSVSLEIAVWEALSEICQREQQAVDGLCSLVDQRRRRASLASCLRIFVLGYFRTLASRHLRAARRRAKTGEDGAVLGAALARLPGPRARS